MNPDAPPVIAVRTVFRDRVWSAIPNYLIEDSPQRVVTAVLPGARSRTWLPLERYDDPSVRANVCATLASGTWHTVETTWHTNRVLWLWPRGASYMIGHYWADAPDVFLGWYFNLQTRLRRSTVGFDLWDQLLDMVVRPDRTWVWKDEDEFGEAVRLGVIGPDEAQAVRAQGESLVTQIDQLVPTGWEDWRPGAGWPPLVLPVGWKIVK
jgi:hypothetical protein